MKYLTDFTIKIKRNRRMLLQCIAITFLCGLIAHGYMLFNNSISHDSLYDFISTKGTIEWKMSLGRIFYPAYQFIARGFTSVFWLIGVLSFLYIGLAVFLVVKLIGFDQPVMILLTAGVMTINVTVISETATYMNDLDGNMFAMLMAVLSVWCWRNEKRGWLWGALPLCLSIGLYQSYISTSITLIMFLCIMDLLRGKSAKNTFFDGLKSIGMICLAGILYFAALKTIMSLSGIAIRSGSYNSVDTFLTMTPKEILLAAVKAWYDTCCRMVTSTSIFSYRAVAAIYAIMIAISAFIVLRRVFDSALGVWEKVLTLSLIAFLPLGMNICRLLTNGMSHDLMHYALWFSSLLVILIVQWNAEENSTGNPKFKKAARAVCMAMAALLVLGNVRLANEVYLVKDFEQDATMSLFTRVTERMEDDGDYIAGETPVAFVGNAGALLQIPKEYDRLCGMTGMGSPSAVTYLETIDRYFQYVLMMPINAADADTAKELSKTDAVRNMPDYPAQGSVQIIDGVMVVKFPEK